MLRSLNGKFYFIFDCSARTRPHWGRGGARQVVDTGIESGLGTWVYRVRSRVIFLQLYDLVRVLVISTPLDTLNFSSGERRTRNG